MKLKEMAEAVQSCGIIVKEVKVLTDLYCEIETDFLDKRNDFIGFYLEEVAIEAFCFSDDGETLNNIHLGFNTPWMYREIIDKCYSLPNVCVCGDAIKSGPMVNLDDVKKVLPSYIQALIICSNLEGKGEE